MRYGFAGGDNLLGWVPETVVKTDLGEWRPWGGHRLWSAPEHMPRSYSPDNDPVDVQVSGRTVTLTQAVEPKTGIEKVLTVTLAETGHRRHRRPPPGESQSLGRPGVAVGADHHEHWRHDHPAAGAVCVA